MTLFFEFITIAIIVCLILYLFGFDKMFAWIANFLWLIALLVALGFVMGFGIKLAGMVF